MKKRKKKEGTDNRKTGNAATQYYVSMCVDKVEQISASTRASHVPRARLL